MTTDVAAPATRLTPSRRASTRREGRLGMAMVLVPVIGTVLFGIAPLVAIFWYSLHDWRPLSGRFDFVGLENFSWLFTERAFQNSLMVTAVFVLGVVVSETIVALVLAVLLNRVFKGIGLFRAAFFAPVVVAYVAWVLVWDYLLASNGTVNSALAEIGITGPDWLNSPSTALASIVMLVLFKGVGQNMILFLAALQGIPSELKEAGSLDGASPWRSFWSISFPLLSPTVMMVLILTTVGALNIFVPIQLLTGGGPGDSTNVLSYYLYDAAFRRQEFGLGSAVGVILFVVVLILTLAQWNLRKRWVHDEH